MNDSIRRPFLSACLIATAILAAWVPRSEAQTFEAKLWQQDSAFSDHFGRTVFLAGGTALVTEPGIDEAGTLHVYERIGPVWTALTTFTAADPAAGARFGDALWLDGDTLAVGAPYDSEYAVGAGAVYVFERNRAGTPDDPTDDRWSQTAKLHPSSGSPPGLFGLTVCLRNDTLLVGAAGGAFVFVRDDLGTPDPLDDAWLQQAHVTPLVGLTLGRAVLLLPGARTALLGGEHAPGGGDGLVRIFHRHDEGTPADPLDDLWLEADALTGTDVGGTFGYCLAFAGSTLLVGGGYHAGALPWQEPMTFVGAYDLDDGGTPGVPADDVWIHGGEMPNPGWPMYSGFGSSLALTDGPGPQVALVNAGHYAWSGPPVQGGILCSFVRVGGRWIFHENLQAPDDAIGDGFGDSLVIDGELALIGARGAPYNEMIEEPPVEGSAWVLDLATPSPWVEQLYTHPLAGWGRLASGWPVTVRLYNAKEYPPYVLVVGLSAIYAPFKGETMVPLPQLLIPLFTGANDDVAVGGAWPHGIPAGTEFWFQVWHPAAPPALWTTTSVLVATQP